MGKIKIYVAIFAIAAIMFVGLTAPTVARAEWWNPISWFEHIVGIFSTKDNSKPAVLKSETNNTPAPPSAENPEYHVSGEPATTSENTSEQPQGAPSSAENPEYRVSTPANDANPSSGTAGSGVTPSSDCPTNYVPVCGVDGITYRNYCELERAGIEYYYGSACTASGASSASTTPPAGSSVQPNSSTAGGNTAAGSESTGACPGIYTPVCGTDGVTYDNFCELQQAGAHYYYGSACITPAASSGSGSTAGTGQTSAGSGSGAGTNTGAASGGGSTPAPSTDSGSGSADSGAANFECGKSATPSQSVNLAIRPNSYYYRPIPATTGKTIEWWASIVNVGPNDMGEWSSENVGIGTRCFSTAYLRIDLNGDGTWDVLKKRDIMQLRATDASWVDHQYIAKVGTWTAIAGNHKWQICADGANDIDENNESDNCVEGTIEVK